MRKFWNIFLTFHLTHSHFVIMCVAIVMGIQTTHYNIDFPFVFSSLFFGKGKTAPLQTTVFFIRSFFIRSSDEQIYFILLNMSKVRNTQQSESSAWQLNSSSFPTVSLRILSSSFFSILAMAPHLFGSPTSSCQSYLYLLYLPQLIEVSILSHAW